MSDWTKPGLSIKERARLVCDELGRDEMALITSALHAAATEARRAALEEAAQLLEDGARVSELHARETICPQTRDRFLHLAKFERLHAEDIRALTKKENE